MKQIWVLFKQTHRVHSYRPDAITLNMHPLFTNITANHRYDFRVSINLKREGTQSRRYHISISQQNENIVFMNQDYSYFDLKTEMKSQSKRLQTTI